MSSVCLENVLIVLLIVLVVHYYVAPHVCKRVDSFGTVYDQSYIAPYPSSQTTPYAGPQGYGQWFTSGPPNVG